MAEVDLSWLARQVAAGDAEAFRGIVRHTQARLYRLTVRLLGNPSDAEDTLQDAYMKAYQALREERFDGRSSVQTWLYRVVTNTAIDAGRRRRLRPVASAEQQEAEPPEHHGMLKAEARVALGELNSWLARLSPEQRSVLVLRTVEGFSTSETAAILGCSEGAVEQRLLRARANLMPLKEEP